MSAVKSTDAVITPEDYLAAELLREVRHEYIDGYVCARPDSSDVHCRIVMNLAATLGNHLEDHPCEVFCTNLKLRTRRTVFFYPDVMVCCDPTDDEHYWRERPRYVFEVASPETANVDRGMKALEYLSVPSIEAYFTVAQDRLEVVVHTRGGGDVWVRATLTQPDALVRLPSIGFEISLARIYRRTGVGE